MRVGTRFAKGLCFLPLPLHWAVKPDCPPSMMLKYLTRYLTGGPISDRRIVGEKDGPIYFMARSKRKGEGQVETSLSRVEFVRQWSLHILPKEYTKSRFYGEWSGRKQPKGQQKCAHCGGEMQCILNEPRPKWRELFYGPSHPSWFEWTSHGQCIPPDAPIEKSANDVPPTESEPDIFDEIIASQRR